MAFRIITRWTRVALTAGAVLLAPVLGVHDTWAGTDSDGSPGATGAPKGSPPVPDVEVPGSESAVPVLPTPTAKQPGTKAPLRVVLLPVTVGASERPTAALIESVAAGLRENAGWNVLHAADGAPFVEIAPAEISGADRAAWQEALTQAEIAREGGSTTDAIAAFASLVDRVQTAKATGPLSQEDRTLLLRAGAGWVQSLALSGQENEARAIADRVARLLPGHKAAGVVGISPIAAALLSSARPDGGVEVALLSRPEGCNAEIDGVVLGASPQKVFLQPGEPYYVRSICTGTAQGSPISLPGQARTGVEAGQSSRLRKVVLDAGEGVRTVVSDADFERAFVNVAGLPAGPELRFLNPHLRRQLESDYARRIAESLDAEIVVLLSLGDLGGNQWVNARLFLSSGFKNRQGLARVEPHRALALGRYLASGKDSDEVLRAEEAGAMVARSRAAPIRLQVNDIENPPWYTDITGWTLTGVGIVGIGVGLWLNGIAADRFGRADFELRGMPEEQQRTRADGQFIRFWGQAGVFGGGVMIATGAILLIAPEYGESRSELFAISPTPGGAEVSFRGRF